VLTTPQINKSDDVFPGEGQFLYWKTSASLWESKLQNSAVAGQVYVPINWSIHTPNPDQYDFGDVRPETDLKKLQVIADKLNIKLTFIMNIGPMPFVINGGLPSFLAKTPSLNKDGVQIFNFDRSNNINQMYSFYNPRVYQYFNKFLNVLNKYFIANAISAEIIGAEYFYYLNETAVSYLEDYSADYTAGFHRYINQIEQEDIEKFEQIKLNKKLEQQIEDEYKTLIRSLYKDSVNNQLRTNLLGFRNYLLLGSSFENTVERSLPDWEEKNNFFNSMFYAIYNNFIPLSCLLDNNEKDDCLDEALKNIVNKDFIESGLDDHSLEDKNGFETMNLFNIFSNSSIFKKIGLNKFFDSEFKWTYKMNPDLNLDFDENVYIFCKDQITSDEFNYALKVFMNGGVVFLNEESLSEDMNRKLTMFLAENSIESQSVRLGVIVKSSSLGQGSLFRFNVSELTGITEQKQFEFWNKIVSTMDLKHPVCSSDKDLYFVWLNRFSNSYELDFEQIRRVSIYNPTNYKKTMKIKGHKNLSFLKSIDERSVQLNSTQKALEIELKPKGSVSLDFGLFE
jgi:hypothetical protein